MKSSEKRRGKVWLVGAGPGDPDLITVRGRELLRSAEVILHDALSHPELLEHCRGATIIDVGKRYGERATAQAEITRLLLELAGEQGKQVVRLKGGDPLLFARGAEEALALSEAGIEFEVVPGISSTLGVAAYAGISLTHRDLSSSVTLITGSDRDGRQWSPEAWRKLATATGTICVVMGMRRIEEITRAIIEGGREPSTPVAVVEWGARPEQRSVTGTLATIAAVVRERGLGSPALVIVGEVVDLKPQLDWYEKKPLFGRRLLLPRPRAQAEATAREVRIRGAAPRVAPAIEIGDPDDPAALEAALLRAASYDWVVFTSSNGVERAFAALRRLGKDARVFGAAKIAVIGPRTRARLAEFGVVADLEPESYVAESLVSALAPGLRAGNKALLLRAAAARDVVPVALRELGVEVDVVAAYRTRPVEGEARVLLDRGVEEADAILLTSSSMVDSLVDALGNDAARRLSGKVLASIGPITSGTLRARGLEPSVEATSYTVPGLLDALEVHFGALR